MQNDLPATVSYDRKGNPALPAEPFPSAGDARTYAAAMISSDSSRSGERTRTDDVLNGCAPIRPEKLRAKKLGWFPNTNHRQMEGYIGAPQTAFYDLVTEADPCIEVYLDYGTGDEQVRWEEAIATNWTWLMLRRWRMGLNHHIPMCQREMLVHGLGAHVWPQMHLNNWIERTPRNGHILFPEDSPVNFEEEGEAFMLRDFVSLHTLYGWIKNEGAAQRLGWIPNNCWKAMAETSKAYKSQGGSLDRWEDYKRQERRGDIGGSVTRQSGLWINWLFTREIETGEISLYAVAENVDPGGYLFKKRFLYDTWPLALFPYDIGNGTIHSIRGLGARSRNFFELLNRVKNFMAAQVILGSTIPLQATGNVDPTKLKLLKLGMMSIIPENLQIAQGFRFQDLSQGPLAFDQMLQDTLRTNTQSYISGTPEPRDRETAMSFSMRAQDMATVNKGTHGLYGSHLCNYYEKKLRMVIKAAKMSGDKPYIVMAKEFAARCKKDGVPDEAFDHICEVREVMSGGAGSAAARLQQFTLLFQTLFPNTTEDRKVNLLRDFTAQVVPAAKVDRYAPSVADSNLPNDEDSFIALENDVLSRGGKAVAAPHQNPVKHAQGHLQGAGAVAQAEQQGQMPPEQALPAIRAFGQHIADHLKALSQNPTRKAEYTELSKELEALGSFADQLQGRVEAGAQAQQEQQQSAQQLSEKGQLDLMKALSQEQVRNVKAQGHEQRAWQSLGFQQRIEDAKAAAEVRRKNTLALTR